MVGLSVPGDVLVQPNAYMLDQTTGANLLTIAVGHSLDTLNYVLGEFADLSAVSDLRRPLITIKETRQQILKTAADQIAVIGTLTSGATASIHVREAVAGGTGFLWEINGTDGTLRITADAAYPEIFPLTVAGAHGQDELAELAVPAALIQKWPELTTLEGAPAYNVGRAYAAFAADIGTGTHTVPGFADALRRHEIIDAIERSATSGERVKLQCLAPHSQPSPCRCCRVHRVGAGDAVGDAGQCRSPWSGCNDRRGVGCSDVHYRGGHDARPSQHLPSQRSGRPG
jgi:predicted dehydrogenase